MKRTSFYAALALLLLAGPAAAQGYEPGVLPPHEIITMVSSTQFEPIGRPMRRGPNYLLRALDQYDREVTLTVNARSGQIIAVTPTQTASRMPPSAPPGGSMGEWQRMPPGYMPPPGYRPGAPIVDEDDDELPPRPSMRPPAPVPGALPRAGQPSAPVASAAPPDDDDDVQPRQGAAGASVIPADRDQGGLLPPPPERFPQRVAPSAPPKPAQRAAAAPPKTAPTAAPLPRPKPSAPPASSGAAPPAAPAAVQPAPAKNPAADDTPH